MSLVFLILSLSLRITHDVLSKNLNLLLIIVYFNRDVYHQARAFHLMKKFIFTILLSTASLQASTVTRFEDLSDNELSPFQNALVEAKNLAVQANNQALGDIDRETLNNTLQETLQPFGTPLLQTYELDGNILTSEAAFSYSITLNNALTSIARTFSARAGEKLQQEILQGDGTPFEKSQRFYRELDNDLALAASVTLSDNERSILYCRLGFMKGLKSLGSDISTLEELTKDVYTMSSATAARAHLQELMKDSSSD